LVSRIEKAGFKDCLSEFKFEWGVYEGKEGVGLAVDTFSRLYATWIEFREGDGEGCGKRNWLKDVGMVMA
jgi:hypothetical protein